MALSPERSASLPLVSRERAPIGSGAWWLRTTSVWQQRFMSTANLTDASLCQTVPQPIQARHLLAMAVRAPKGAAPRSTRPDCHKTSLCPFCVQRHLTRFNFPSFFNVLEEPFVRASLLLSYCRSCVLFHRAADLVTELLISRLKVRFLPRSPFFSKTCQQSSPHGSTLSKYHKRLNWRTANRDARHTYGTPFFQKAREASDLGLPTVSRERSMAASKPGTPAAHNTRAHS